LEPKDIKCHLWPEEIVLRLRDDEVPFRKVRTVFSLVVSQFGNVSPNACHVVADRLHGPFWFLLATARDEDIGALSYEELCCSQPYSRGPPSDNRHFSSQLGHYHLLPL
jgi:hypothetical protein